MRLDIPTAVTIQRIFDSAENVKTFVLETALDSKPGQFVMLWLPGIDEKPFSIALDRNSELHLTICAVGKFTQALFQKKPGAKIGLRGPFGKGYTLPEQKKVLLIGGGYGMAPLYNCGLAHQKNGSEVTAISGARSAANVLFEAECTAAGFHTVVTTDDGSRGLEGRVTTAFEKLLAEGKTFDLVQTCGPEKMMHAVAELCLKQEIECEVSIERYMKCGFGVCGQCVVEGTGERMCVEGPVVSGAHALKHFPDFGKTHRGAEGQKIMW